MAKMYWKQQKAFAMLQNRRQWARDLEPEVTTAIEILLENGNYLVDETRIDLNAQPFEQSTYIIAEHIN